MITKTVGHTPGPWASEDARPFDAELKDNFVRHATRIYAEDPGPENSFTIGFVSDVHVPTRNANARLIAAAPELLEALETLLYWRDLAVKEGKKQVTYNTDLTMFTDAEAIIRKARGE